MFKKLKDKLAEEVKSSPQRIQQFAQAAQAAVTSASSSISDITNSDLFSIGDNDNQQSQPQVRTSPGDLKNTFQDVSLTQTGNQPHTDSIDLASTHDYNDTQRQRRLSNSSFASDISFRLPSYESPSMYHLQSDMEISASEAEERGFGGAVSLDRVTKEQIYAAYRRTQERYSKYRTQYADLARHYKLLERENAKARSVLVETQDKTLRRISELREQCALEQSAKAHLEKALRVEIEEKNMKIDTLETKIHFLQQSNPDVEVIERKDNPLTTNENNVQLITFDNENNQLNETSVTTEIETLNSKIDKLEKLVNKYKDSFKAAKEKNAQLTTEIQILTTELDGKKKNIDELKISNQELDTTKQQIQELNELNEQLQNKINAFDFNKSKEMTTLELDFQKSQEEIAQLRGRIEIFSKREEEYAISLAENKLSIHKELEGKENEIKSLKDRLAESKQEIQSLNIVISDYKNKISQFEEENAKHKNDTSEINSTKTKLNELETQVLVLSEKCAALESRKAKADEEYKCLQLQLKQETAEKLAMIDRNTYLEERNTQLSEENTKKTLQIKVLDNDLQGFKKERKSIVEEDNSEKQKLLEEISLWKNKYSVLEAEIQEERDELVKLQSEIEKLLANDELIQIQNTELNIQLNELKSENKSLLEKVSSMRTMKKTSGKLIAQVTDLRNMISLISSDSKSLKEQSNKEILALKNYINSLLLQLPQSDEIAALKAACEEHKTLHYASRMELKQITEENQTMATEFNLIKEENNKLKQEINDNELKTHNIEEELQKTKDEIQHTCNEKKILEEKMKETDARYAQLQDLINKDDNELFILKQDIVNMTEKTENLENNIDSLKTLITTLEKERDDHVIEIHKLKDERESLLIKIKKHDENKQLADKKLQAEVKDLQEENVSLKTQCATISKLIEEQNNALRQINTLKDENTLLANEYKNYIGEKQSVIEKLEENINSLMQENVALKTESEAITDLKKEHKENIDQISTLKEENHLLVSKHQYDDKEKQTLIERLQDNLKDTTQENISLKTQFEKITNSVKDLEVELREVRKSHTEIEIEKDRLNDIIEDLAKRQRENEISSKNTQTESEKVLESKEKVDIIGNLFSSQDIMQKTSEDTNTYSLLLSKNDSLIEENKRLQSDVTGLQAYLAKISKENSELNDKLRELIACSEHSSDKKDIDLNLVELKEKLDNLIRENTLLVEENFELKDQLSSQNYMVPGAKMGQNQKSSDYLSLQEKYNNMMDNNNKLEQRMMELEAMNKSVNGNMMQIQEKNEKLRLTNEKLERRLDEALVSLRHLHSLQENTELEYLRNILYEYLTGTGAHSITLAKVLAAVVKFDERQTQQVLLKEKERQGILRQLGII